MSGIVFVVCTLMCISSAEVRKLKLNDGREMPGIALGTFLGIKGTDAIKPHNHDLRDVILNAIDLGYRHIDTSSVYYTEAEIGEAIRIKIDDGTIRRDDIFITTKVWNTHHARDQVPEALNITLKQMGLDYVDLYLMHWPMALNADYSHSDIDYIETWRGLEDVQRSGLAKSIGLSNFNRDQIKRVLEEGSVRPAALQIEVHPQLVQKDLVSYTQSEGIVVMAYSPFGSLVSRYGMEFPGPKMNDPLLSEIAQKYGKTTAQIVLRWLVERNIVPVPKTVKYPRLKENIAIFDFQLTEDEINKINTYNQNIRYTFPSFWQNHPYYPFEKIENPIADPFQSKAEY